MPCEARSVLWLLLKIYNHTKPTWASTWEPFQEVEYITVSNKNHLQQFDAKLDIIAGY